MTSIISKLLGPRQENPYDDPAKNRAEFLRSRQITLEAKHAKLMDIVKREKKHLSDVIDYCQNAMVAARKAGDFRQADCWHARGMRAIEMRNDLCDAETECWR